MQIAKEYVLVIVWEILFSDKMSYRLTGVRQIQTQVKKEKTGISRKNGMVQRISEQLTNDGADLGNKGKFLCVMHNAGFHVPDGIIIDKTEYENFIRVNGIAEQISLHLSELKANNVADKSSAITALFEHTKLTEDVLQWLRIFIKDERKYAVRSSGTKEDLEEFSFAGQYQTFLNTEGVDHIQQAVIDCYKSMFTEVCLNYLVNNRIDWSELAMSVVVQEMVDSEYSGICFSLNPVTGKDTEMSIEVAAGLGENIVSGKVAPEQYYYDWYAKTCHFEESNHIWTEDKVKEYGEIFLKVQLLFGYPCDMEFAVKDGQLYLLQARRITKINYAGLQDIWTTADFKDGGVSASVCTPYMWSLYEYIWEFTLRKYLIDGKILTEQETDKKLGEMFYGRCYWNLSVVKLAMSKIIGYKEREFDSEYGIRITYEGDGATTGLTPGTLLAIARMFFAQKRILKERNRNCESYKKDLLEKYESYKKQYDEKTIGDIKKVWYDLTRKTYLQSEATYFWQIFINTIHQSLYKDSLLKYVSESEYLTLLGAIDNISHLLPFYDMWDISRAIRGDEDLLNCWQSVDVKDLNDAFRNGEDKYGLSFVRKLVDTYGYHSDKELDVTYPCYYEDATPMLGSIRDMLALSDEFSPMEDKKRGEAAYKAILDKIRQNVSKSKYRKIETKIMNMRKMLWWREEYRDISTRFYYIIRVYTMELAKALTAEGVLDREDDIWFTRVSDLWDYLDGKLATEDLQQSVRRKCEYYNAFRNYMSENEIGGAFGEAVADCKTADGQIKGLGANSGRITGTARVIEDFSQIGRLQENDILVTRFTDTGWTPKFAILSGIVTEYGGILCHAAIVSREYGIPAIVSCHDAMKKIKDGDTITIDGSTGVVTVQEQNR